MVSTGLWVSEETVAYSDLALKFCGHIDGFGCDSAMLDGSCSELLQILHPPKHDMLLCSNLVPEDAFWQYITALKYHSENALFSHIYQTMKRLYLGTGSLEFTLPFRLDRLSGLTWNQYRDKSLEFLGMMKSAPLCRDFRLSIPVRYPLPFPYSEEIRRASELCTEGNALPQCRWPDSIGITDVPPLLVTSSFGLVAHVHPEEGVTMENFAKGMDGTLLNSVVFHYDVSANETLFDDEQMQWADYLVQLPQTIHVLFAPKNIPVARYQEILDDVNVWSGYYKKS